MPLPLEIKYSNQEHEYYYRVSSEIVACIKRDRSACGHTLLASGPDFFIISGGDANTKVDEPPNRLETIADLLKPYSSYEYPDYQTLPLPVKFGNPFFAYIALLTPDRKIRLQASFRYMDGQLVSVSFAPSNVTTGRLL